MYKEELPKNSIIESTRFGQIQIDASLLFDFVAPIIGYDKYTYFALIDTAPDSPFKWLQSVSDPNLAFPITLCSYFDIEYNISISKEDLELIGANSMEDIMTLNIVSIPLGDPQGATANLRAPIV
ncbi:flagellar assembly protein FliW, partial [bacterium]|nr:flagellar assembly protein FliW [bacterium]